MAWATCEVTQGGPIEDGRIFLALKAIDGSFERWFQANPTVQKEMLATALMSMSSGMRVAAALPDDLHEWGMCDRLYVQRN
jgi:hypothetical protein